MVVQDGNIGDQGGTGYENLLYSYCNFSVSIKWQHKKIKRKKHRWGEKTNRKKVKIENSMKVLSQSRENLLPKVFSRNSRILNSKLYTHTSI